ncbi:hypothetical protein PPACK8108_LOCUS19128 [Phakopsora pachyrhizi]|uniref:Uncharacterized protein n=1 Tax=Phakopsora pachyrhizi TaxID=170000 RepID=A0AAV0BE67_PHAPC|nr:hypothetical protein PPACK8108_LOCUS19128 [Phakopsora pachyrhizi]
MSAVRLAGLKKARKKFAKFTSGSMDSIKHSGTLLKPSPQVVKNGEVSVLSH